MDTSVVIIGGGPVGLAIAISLSRQGIKCTIVERNKSVTDHPKARGVTARTMELFRQWGVEKAARAFAFPNEAARLTWMTDFTGTIIKHVKADNSCYETISPSSRCLVSQDKIEEVLWNKITSDPNVTVLKEHEGKVLKQDLDHVKVEIRNLKTASTQLLNVPYVIAADGAHSNTRKSLGIQMSGEILGEHCSVYCRMQLGPWLKEGPSVGFFFTSERGAGKVLMSGNAGDLWVAIFRLTGDAAEREKYTPEYCEKEIRQSLGIENLEIEVKSINFWSMSSLVADRFGVGRVFLAGDAAHCVPPTGGYGMNIGVQDAHNLAWKLAYVIKGFAEEQLLATYTEERKPQAKKIISWSKPNNLRIIEIFKAASSGNFSRMSTLLEDQTEHLNSSGLDLGFNYSSALVAPCQTPAPEITAGNYLPTSYPGFRAPHIWLYSHTGEKLSTLDLFEREYVFLTAASKGTWEERVLRLKGQTRIPLRLLRIAEDGDFLDSGEFLRTYGLDRESCVLVRPDGHIAWRCEVSLDQAEKELQALLSTKL